MSGDVQAVDLAAAIIYPHSVIQYGMCYHYQARSGYQFEATGLSGMLVLSKMANLLSNTEQYAIFLLDDMHIVYVLMLPFASIFKYEVSNEDCLVIDDPQFVNMFLFCEKTECYRFYYAMQLVLIKEQTALLPMINTQVYNILSLDITPQIIDDSALNQLAASGNKQINLVFKVTLWNYLNLDVQSPEFYVALVSLYQFYISGYNFQDYDDRITQKVGVAINECGSSLVVSRALKLFYLLVMKDSQLVNKILSRSLYWSNSSNNVSFFDIIGLVLKRKCMNINDTVVLFNQDLIFATINLLSLVFCSNFYFNQSDINQLVKQEFKVDKAINRIFNTYSNKLTIQISDQFDIRGIQQVFDILIGMLVYLSETKQTTLISPQDNIQLYLNIVDIHQQAFLHEGIDIAQELINILCGAIRLSRYQENHYKLSNGQLDAFVGLQFSQLDHKEFNKLVTVLVKQLDIEFTCFILAYQNEQLLQYYIDSCYCSNFSSCFQLLDFIFSVVEFNNSIDVQATTHYQLLQQCFLGDNNLLGILVKYLHYISHSQGFFMDFYLVSLYDNLNISYFISNIHHFLLSYISLSDSVFKFVSWHQSSVHQSQLLLEEISCIMFGIFCHIISKFNICMIHSNYNSFSMLNEQQSSLILNALYSGMWSFHEIIVKRQAYHFSKQFYQSFFHCYQNISQTLCKQSFPSHHSQEVLDQFISFLSYTFSIMTGLLTHFVKHNWSEIDQFKAVLSLLVQKHYDSENRLSDFTKSYRFHEDQQKLMNAFDENLIFLFKALTLGFVNNIDISISTITQDPEKLNYHILVLTSLVNKRFKNDYQILNIQTVIDEILLFDSFVNEIEFDVMQLEQRDLLFSCLIFSAKLIKIIKHYKVPDILFLNLLKSFINSTYCIFCSSINEQLLDQVVEDVCSLMDFHLGMFQICVLVMKTIPLITGEYELYDVSLNMFVTIMNFFKLPNNFTHLLILLKNLFDQSQTILLTEFLSLASQLVDLPYYGNLETKDNIDMQLSQLCQFIITLTYMNAISQQTQQKFLTHGLDIIKDQVDFHQIVRLFISNNIAVWNTDNFQLFNFANVYIETNQLNDELLIQLSKQFLSKQSDQVTQNNGLYILFHTLCKLCTKIRDGQKFLIEGDKSMLEKFIDEQFMDQLFMILSLKINDHYFGIEAVVVVIEIFCMLFETIPNKMKTLVSFYKSLFYVFSKCYDDILGADNQQLLRLRKGGQYKIRQNDKSRMKYGVGNQVDDVDSYVNDLRNTIIASILKILYNQIRVQKEETTEVLVSDKIKLQFNSLFHYILKFCLLCYGESSKPLGFEQNKQSYSSYQVNILYYCFFIINGLLEPHNAASYALNMIYEDHHSNLRKFIETIHVILFQFELENADTLQLKDVVLLSIKIIFNLLELCQQWINQPDKIMDLPKDYDDNKISDTLKKCFFQCCYDTAGNVSKSHFISLFQSIYLNFKLINYFTNSDALDLISNTLIIFSHLSEYETLNIEELLCQAQNRWFIQFYVQIFVLALQHQNTDDQLQLDVKIIDQLNIIQKIKSDQKQQQNTVLTQQELQLIERYVYLDHDHSIVLLIQKIQHQIETLLNSQANQDQFKYSDQQKPFHQIHDLQFLITRFVYNIVKCPSTIQYLERLTYEIFGFISGFFYSIAIFQQLIAQKQHKQNICNELQQQQIRSANIVYMLLQVSETCKLFFIKPHLQEIVDEIQSQLTLLEQENSTTLEFYLNIVNIMSETQAFKKDLAENYQLLICCGKLVLQHQDSISNDIFNMAINIICNYYSEETRYILLTKHINHGMDGVPFIRIVLKLLEHHNDQAKAKIIDKQRQISFSLVLQMLQIFLNVVKFSEQCSNDGIQRAIKQYIPECYGICTNVTPQTSGIQRECYEAAQSLIREIKKQGN